MRILKELQYNTSVGRPLTLGQSKPEAVPPAPDFIDKVSKEQMGGLQKIKGSVEKGASNIQKGMEQGGIKGVPSTLLGTAQAGFGTIAGVAQTALAPIGVAGSELTKAITPALREGNPTLAKAYDLIAPKIQEWASKHPDATELTGDIINTLLMGIGGGKASKLTEGALNKDALKESLSSAGKDIASVHGKIASSLEERAAQKETQSIQDAISPKAGVKEARIATKEGRLIKGKDSTFFKSGTPDKIIPTEKLFRATETIKKEIPGFSKLDESQQYTALNTKTGEMANALKPEMQKVEITTEMVKKIDNKWRELKEKQITNADSDMEGNVKKIQGQFEDRLKKVQKTKNMDDIWQERVSYDKSIPDNVKKANELSDSRLQMKHELWIQNREILNGAIHDVETGLGGTSKKSFSDMSDLYDAQNNLISKAKIETKIKPSKISQALDSPITKGLIKGAIGAGLGVGGLELLRR